MNVRAVLRHCVPNKGLRSLAPLCGYPCRLGQQKRFCSRRQTTFGKAIYVDAPVKVNGKRTQNIHIQYDGIGFIPLDELLKQEAA